MEELQKVIDRCKATVHLTVNDHKTEYKSVAEYLENPWCIDAEIDDDVKLEMMERDTIIDLQFYPHTPIGSYSVYHYDLDLAIQEANRILDGLS